MKEFDEVRFPEDISYGATGGPEYFTNIICTTNGKEYRTLNGTNSKMRYNISYAVKTSLQMEKLVTFFRARRGRAVGFRLKDWCDYKAEMQLLGIGDGINKAFQLKKIYKSEESTYERIIYKPVISTVIIYVNNEEYTGGVEVNHQSGEIKFESTVGLGDKIFATFEFDLPVRFDIDHLPISIDEHNTYSSKNINLVEIRL
ncbi:DUF2460 domain-containing protein [Candidatus Bandiella euplotis]|uniref:DUF2460 protein n=1 Tax=Candidatus Bandiella euplotis TaxID=1664265 RepID=A0ABZ0UL57_9RICK|nr:DUF2460 domain-containing protein [Candidatus Bandiella woodruffii]WPX96861.1 DUF2460 protein [Candidatus Bandiella woodruffii]